MMGRTPRCSPWEKACEATASCMEGWSMRRLLRLILISVALGEWVCAAPCWAGLVQGVNAYKLGDFATAVHELLPLAQQGQAEAQFYLGAMASKGWGVPQDDTA